MDSIELIDELVKRAEEHQKQNEIKFALAQLDVLQTSADKLTLQDCYYEGGNCCQFILLRNIINNQIYELRKELKGENNER